MEEVESSDHAARLITRACRDENVPRGTLTLHADNGGPIKGATMLATLQKLQVASSFSRPSYPDGAFGSLDEART